MLVNPCGFCWDSKLSNLQTLFFNSFNHGTMMYHVIGLELWLSCMRCSGSWQTQLMSARWLSEAYPADATLGVILLLIQIFSMDKCLDATHCLRVEGNSIFDFGTCPFKRSGVVLRVAFHFSFRSFAMILQFGLDLRWIPWELTCHLLILVPKPFWRCSSSFFPGGIC